MATLKTMTDKFALLAPYPEGAIHALGTRLNAQRGNLEYVTPSRTVSRIAALGATLVGNPALAARMKKGITPWRATEIAGHLDLLRLLVQATRYGPLQQAFMYWSKNEFDLIASKGENKHQGVNIGMPGACSHFFSKHRNALNVFHEVDSRPSVHNQILLNHFPRRFAERELIPKWVESKIEREIDLTDVILTPSRFVARQFENSAQPHQSILIQPYGVDFAGFSPGPESNYLQRRRPVLLFVGQISLRKGLPYLLKAVEDQSVDLLLAGPMVNEHALVSLPENARYLGAQSRAQVQNLMRSADAFVLPSIEDACALVVAEAIASGLPVVTTTSNGASEFLTEEDARLTKPGDLADLRRAINQVEMLTHEGALQRAQRIRTLGPTARSQPRLGSWEHYADIVIKELTALADRKRGVEIH